MVQPNDMRPASATLSRVSTTAKPSLPALHDVSFAIARGEILTLLGTVGTSGGSGTGTVTALLAGFARALSGEVTIGGRMMDATPTHRRGLGVVMRRLSLFPHVTVAGHAGFAPGVTPAQADAILKRLDLQAFARRRWQGLSPELQFRVALARALAPAPTLLLLEDPFAALPHAAAAALKALLRDIAAETGLSVLHTTDDADTLYGLADRVGVIQSGRLRQIGTPQELYDNPLTLAVAEAMGPLNKLPGNVVEIEDDIAIIRLIGGANVEARFIDTLDLTEPCIVTLRPERIAVAAVLVGEMSEGAVPAHLVETVFTGGQQHLRFSLDGRAGVAPEVIVIRPSGAILPRNPAMCLAWQPHHAQAFKAESA